MRASSVVIPFMLAIFAVSNLAAQQPQREVAITIDDLPAASPTMGGKEMDELTAKLLATLKQNNVPVVGFVNEKKLYVKGEVDDRIAALRMWTDNGFELGNHTFSHASLNQHTLKDWEEEVIRGETVTSMLLAEHKMKIRYLRHPYLDTGRDLETRRDAENFLAQRGYRIAPVTMDAWDWMYGGVYETARKKGDTALEQKLVASYLEHTNDVFDYYEKFSKQLIGYEPAQILLLHCNWLEAEHIGELLDTLRKRGYKFVSLQEALSDSAYGLPDTFVSEEGTNWIDHWAITQGKFPQHTPEFPQWVIDLAHQSPHVTEQPY